MHIILSCATCLENTRQVQERSGERAEKYSGQLNKQGHNDATVMVWLLRWRDRDRGRETMVDR